jgi:hypothetical protein
MANSPTGRPTTQAAYDRMWERFDALPSEVKAAMWDSLQDYDAKGVADTCDQSGPRIAIALVRAWDCDVLGQRKPWLRKGAVRPGTRREAMPPSPHRAAEATMLRPHVARYRRLMVSPP